MDGKKLKIFRKFQSNLLKRAFTVPNDGSCVRLSVAEKVLREAIAECCEEEQPTIYDFWGQEVRGLE